MDAFPASGVIVAFVVTVVLAAALGFFLGRALTHSRYVERLTRAETTSRILADRTENLEADAQVRWREGLHGSVHSDVGAVRLTLPTKTLSFPAVCGPALQSLLDGAPVTAGALPGLDAADGLVVVKRLLREAVLVAL